MSNNSLISNIESALAAARSPDSILKLLADSIRENGRALERMPYPLIQKMESLAMDLEIASWADADGFVPDVQPIFIKVETWLRQLPRDVA